jgi:subfamily B ATP-binding cassette protein HlyB/CyaB
MVMPNAEQVTGRRVDTALECLVVAARMLGISVEREQLRRGYVVSADGMDALTLMRAAKELSLKARLIQPEQTVFAKLPLPAIAILKNGQFVIVAQTDGAKVAIIDPLQPRPFTVPIANFFELWSGRMILLARHFALKEQIKSFGVSWFFPVVMRYKRFFVQVLFLSFLLQLFGLGSPLFTQVIIDKVLVHRSANTLDILLVGMFFVGLFQAWMTALRSYLFTHTTNKVDVTLGSQLFRHIAALSIKYFETWQVGDIVSRVRELDNIRQFITGTALTVVLDIVFAVVYVIVMVTYSTALSGVTFVAVLLYILLSLIVTPIFRRRLTQRFFAGTENQSFLIETVTGIQTVKSLAVEQQFIDKYEGLLSRYAKTVFASINIGNIAGNIGTLIQSLFTIAILWVGAHAVMDNKLSVGELIAFQMIAGQVIAPILRLINMWQNFQQTMVSVDRLGDIMNEKAEPAFNPGRTTLPALSGEILLDRVTFRYRQDGNEILRQVAMHIKAGMRVGIVGRSGSGKSTLTKLIQRLHVPESGRVLIDGVDLVQVEPAWLRRQIGVVLQENFLFGGTIRDNIAIANPHATMEEVVHVAKIAGADEFISELAKGYDTPVGERGALLSGGQRQRIAIARALMTNPRVLIFDEATSALDYESERIIMSNLDAIANGRTMIMIAHRLSTVRRCDIIFVMERGSIVEQGSHDELLAHKGYYHSLYSQQEKIQ